MSEARRCVALVALVAASMASGVVMSGCAPPELMEAADAIEVDAGAQDDTGPQDDAGPKDDTGPKDDAGAGETGVSEEVSFGRVADIVRGSCAATPSCHGDAALTNFRVEGNAAATDAQIRTAIEDVTTIEGLDMVVPGDAEVSALYVRLVATGVRMMPPAGQPALSEDDIETVRLWIEEGANYE